MPTVRSGQMATKGTNAVNTDRPVVQMLPRVFKYDPPSNPALRVLTARAQVRPVKGYEVKWLEHEPVPEWDTTTNSGSNSTDPIPVSNGTYHRAGDIILIPGTGEYVRVEAVSSNNLDVARGFAGSSAQSYASGQKLLNLGQADMEGNTSPVAKTSLEVTKSNFTQIVKTPVHLSRTLSQVELYGGNERAERRNDAMGKHGRLLELQFFHGKKREDTSTATNPIRLAGGLDDFITTNKLAAGGALTESELFEWLGVVFRHGVGGASTRKVMFAGMNVMNSIQSWGQAKLQTNSGARQQYGFDAATLVTPYGYVDLVYHPLLEEEYAGYAYVVDMRGIQIGVLQPTVLQTDIQANDEDGFKDQYLSELTFIIAQEKAHGVISGVTF